MIQLVTILYHIPNHTPCGVNFQPCLILFFLFSMPSLLLMLTNVHPLRSQNTEIIVIM